MFHTFQGGCSGTGDSVADTPAHTQNLGCPTRDPDTCPGQSGSDPIHNYMSYSDDNCMTEFTENQYTRMRAMWHTYRRSN